MSTEKNRTLQENLNPDCVPTCRDSETQKTIAKGAVGPILLRRHIHKYVEEQNRDLPTSRDSKDFQVAVGGYCTIWVKALIKKRGIDQTD